MPYASVNNIKLYYEVHGTGPPLIFTHGSGGNHLSWWQQIPYFAQFYTCVTYDHRSFGKSEDETPPQGRAAFAEDLKGLIRHLDLPKVAIIAHSMGGRSGSMFALRNPGQVAALILSGSNGGSDSTEARKVREAHKSYPPFHPKGALRALSPGYTETEQEKAFLYRQIMRSNPPHKKDFLEVPRNLIGRSTHDKFNELSIPTLFLTGEEDILVHPETIKIAAELIPHSEFISIKGAGHSTYYEKPDVFNRLVRNFLTKHRWDASSTV